ncbi:MAG: CdaR family protein [Candidatus Peregrinibacteria bacterium]|nr:CdaR family protein [Candidatus Peregrinibacteria bacterium]MDZ4244441.1 CdaR family protein [Candidatus Gracilibacteria bacterium]
MKINLFKNLPFKIFALLLAVSFWFFLIIFQNVIYDVPEALTIQVLNSPTGVEIANPLPEIVVRVTAPKDDTAFLHAEEFKAQIDLTGLKEGVHKLPIRVSTEKSNVNIVSYIPREVEVTLEEIETKSFAIRAEIVGSPAPEYSIGESLYSTRKATVKGPSSLINSIAYIGHKIELTGQDKVNIKNTYTLVAYDEDGEPIDHSIKITPETVSTELQLVKELGEKLAFISLQYAEDVDVTRINGTIIKPSNILIRGRLTDLADILSIKTEPLTVDDIEKIITGGEFFVKLVIPDNVTWVNEDQKVTVEIK